MGGGCGQGHRDEQARGDDFGDIHLISSLLTL
jgi:hypothetical protein